MIIADHVYRDVSLGMRSALGAAQFPWQHPGIAVYAALTDGRGDTEVRLRLVDVDEAREPIWVSDIVVNFPDPIAEIEVVVFLDDLVFPEPGEYRLQLYGAGQLLRERRLILIPLENPH